MSEASVRVSEEARKRATKSATFTPCAAAGQRQSIALPLLNVEEREYEKVAANGDTGLKRMWEEE